MDRHEQLRAGIDKGMLGIEIGASINPIAPKAAGWNTRVVDHATQAELAAKYADHPNVDTSRIEAVDFIWSGGALHDAVPGEHHGRFDYCIASHVIEHIPDLISFFKSLETLLRPGGVLLLAVPDKRFSFDAFKPFSTTADALEVHLRRKLANRHALKTVFENFAYNVTSGEDRMWSFEPRTDLRIVSTFTKGNDLVEVLLDPAGAYIDCHAWYFTPSSFRLMMLELGILQYSALCLDSLSASAGGEFIAKLHIDAAQAKTVPADLQEQRLALMISTLAEQAEQYESISESLRAQSRAHLPEGHPHPNSVEQEHKKQLAQITGSVSWQLVSRFWTEVDKVKRRLKMPTSSHS